MIPYYVCRDAKMADDVCAVMMGKTALAAATDHVLIVDDKRRFAFYAMPHILRSLLLHPI